MWHAGLLIIHLVKAGFDCTYIRILRGGYNLSILLKKRSIQKQILWTHDFGDTELMLPYLPDILVNSTRKKSGQLSIITTGKFNGNILSLNWAESEERACEERQFWDHPRHRDLPGGKCHVGHQSLNCGNTNPPRSLHAGSRGG